MLQENHLETNQMGGARPRDKDSICVGCCRNAAGDEQKCERREKRRSKSMVCAAREENAALGGFSLYRTAFFQYNKTMETNAGASPEGRNKL
jgi:hypothetical protein